MEENLSSRKDSTAKNNTYNDFLPYSDHQNIYTPNEIRMKEISVKIQKDMEKYENTYKYNMESIQEQKEKLAMYINELDDGCDIDIEDSETKGITNGPSRQQIYSTLSAPKIRPYRDEDKRDFKIKHSKDMTEYLEAKLDLLESHRKRKFHEYYREIIQTRKLNNINPKENALFETKKINEIMNKNALKIEKQLLNLFKLEDTEESEDEADPIQKKIKLNTETSFSVKPLGFKISDFFKMSKYRINAMKLPFFSNLFDDATGSLSLLNSLSETKVVRNKTGTGEETTTIVPKKIIKPEIPMFFDDMKKKPLSEKDKENAIAKYKSMSKAEQEKHEEKLLKKQWANVVRGVIRIYRFTQKFKMDVEQNSKKFAILCAKEVKKKIAKSQRASKDFVFRAKRMHREMVVYWRKREKELAELKKKKEKLEAEIRKREDEERETLLQRKRLEFLMRQSDIYAHFMAKKLGMVDNEDEHTAIEGQGQIEGGEPQKKFIHDKVEIDEAAAFNSIQGLINEQREALKLFDFDTQKQRLEQGGPEGQASNLEQCQLNDLIDAQGAAFDFSTVTLDPNQRVVNTPKGFVGDLKEYQIKGLRWLDNLYDQGINGILADEMGLGKTIQAIALLAHICETKGNWGPFLVVAPASTLYNWQQEIHRFYPALKVLPYWGSLKERKTIRKFFQQKNWGTPSSQFHVVVTSYQLIVADEKAFQRLKWQYMILDEAQAIKNINSQRWKILLSFNTRNKLLLTGTPIQNSMAELWALLHFIMPKLFDSHEQFQEWFSKDIEAHSTDQKALNQHQLQRLHAILKPFMLRRVKKDVENEIGQKKEFQVFCPMTNRQMELYNSIKKHLSIKDFFQMFESKAKVENLMNLVMQFRKVCNHPELFERRQCRTSFSFRNFRFYTGHMPVPFGHIKEVTPENKNPICYEMPRLVFDDLYSEFDGKNFLEKDMIYRKYFCLWDSSRIYSSLFGNAHEKKIIHNDNIYSFSRLLNLSVNQVELSFKYDHLYTLLILLHSMKTLGRINTLYDSVIGERRLKRKNMLWINTEIINRSNSDEGYHRLLFRTPEDMLSLFEYRLSLVKAYVPTVSATLIEFTCSSTGFRHKCAREQKPRVLTSLLFGAKYLHNKEQFGSTENIPRLGLSLIPVAKRYYTKPLLTWGTYQNGIAERNPEENMSNIEIPSFESLIADASKLQYLNKLLPDLKRGGHRVLIFCQMTKMMDILEEYLARKKYQFFRLDGSCTVADRRDMVKEFQENPNIFAFILSTRAGGLGVTLTAADTVIFYDSDWNPTMDAQATDRAHRIGQTKDVHVYRLITKGTIEEKIMKRALQKQTVQATVYSGGAFKADIFKPQEVMELLFDENEIDVNETKKFIAKAGTRRKGFRKPEKKEAPVKSLRGRKKAPESGKKDEGGMDMEEEKGNEGAGEKDEDMEVEFDFSNIMKDGEEGDIDPEAADDD